MKIVIGGPCYQMQVTAQHASFLAQLGEVCGMSGHAIRPHYLHTSVLPQGRAQWLASLLDDDAADVGIMIDSDVWIGEPGKGPKVDGTLRLVRLLEQLDELELDAPLVGVVTPQRDGLANAWAAEGRRVRLEDAHPLCWVDDEHPPPSTNDELWRERYKGRHPDGWTIDAASQARGDRYPAVWGDVHAVGLGCAIYSKLNWWRDKVRGYERESFAMIPLDRKVIGAPRFAFLGEDYFHSMWIKVHGGAINAVDIGAVHGRF